MAWHVDTFAKNRIYTGSNRASSHYTDLSLFHHCTELFYGNGTTTNHKSTDKVASDLEKAQTDNRSKSAAMSTMEAQVRSHAKQIESKEATLNKLQLKLTEAESEISTLSGKAVAQTTVDELKAALQKSESMREHEQGINTQAGKDAKAKLAEMERSLNAAADVRRDLVLRVDALTVQLENAQGAAARESLQLINQAQANDVKRAHDEEAAARLLEDTKATHAAAMLANEASTAELQAALETARQETKDVAAGAVTAEQHAELRAGFDKITAELRAAESANVELQRGADAAENVCTALRADVEELKASTTTAQQDASRTMQTLQRRAETVKALKAKLEDMQARLAAHETTIEKLQGNGAIMKQELATTQSNVTSAASSIENSENSNVELNLKIEELKGRLFTQSQAVGDLEESKQKQLATIATLEEEKAALGTSVAEAQEMTEELFNEVSELTLKNEQQEAAVEAQQAKCAALEESVGAANAKVTDLAEQLEAGRSAAAEIGEAVEEAVKAKSAAEQLVTANKRAANEAAAANDKLESEVSKLKANMEMMEMDSEDQMAMIDELTAQNENLTASVEKVQVKNAALEAGVAAAKEAAAAGQTQADARTAELEEALDGLRNKNENLGTKISELEAEVYNASKTLAVGQIDAAELNAARMQLEEYVEGHKSNAAALTQSLNDAALEISDLKAAADAAATAASAAAAESSTTVASIEQKVEDLQASVAAESARALDAEAKRDALSSRCAQFEAAASDSALNAADEQQQLSSDLQVSKTQHAAAATKVEELQAHVDELEAELESAEAAKSSLQSEAEAANAAMLAIQALQATAANQIEALQSEVASAMDTNEGLALKNGDLQASLEETRKAAATADEIGRESSASLESLISSLTEQLHSKTERVTELEGTVEEAAIAAAMVSSAHVVALAEQSAQIEQLAEDNSSHAARAEEAEAQCAELAVKCNAFATTIAEKEKAVAELSSTIEDASKSSSSMAEEYNNTISELKEHIDVLEGDVQSWSAAGETSEMQVAELESKCEALEAQVADAMGTLATAAEDGENAAAAAATEHSNIVEEKQRVVASLREQLGIEADRANNAERKNVDLTSRCEQLQTDAQNAASSSADQLQIAKEELTRAKEEHDATSAELAAIQAHRDQLTVDLEAAVTRSDTLTAELAQAQQAIDEMAASGSEVSTVLNEQLQSKISTIMELEAAAEREAAVAAAAQEQHASEVATFEADVEGAKVAAEEMESKHAAALEKLQHELAQLSEAREIEFERAEALQVQSNALDSENAVLQESMSKSSFQISALEASIEESKTMA